jgi:SBF-like CPA transporter family (DUF4137)
LALVHYLLKYDPYESVALVILSSQKSAPVAMTVISYITHITTQQGLLAIPSIIGQLAQIFIGSALAPFIEKGVKAFLISQKEEQQPLAVTNGADPIQESQQNVELVVDSFGSNKQSGDQREI